MRKKLTSLSLVAFLGLGGLAMAQVTGVVNDASNLPEMDVEVSVKGTDKVAYTDENGRFDIDAKIGDVLVINGKEFTVTSNNLGVIKAISENVDLGEVTIIGYGINETLEQKTGSYVTVKAEDLEKNGSVSFDQALQGQVAGLNVNAASGQPGAQTPMFVRGITSLTANAMPLVVVNGVPVTTGDMAGVATSSNPLASIDPTTIESVTVLKDAVGTALYGSRGANGVIVVTLKKGSKAKNKFSFNSEFGFGGVAYEKNDWLDAQGHVNAFTTAYANSTGRTFDQAYPIIVNALGWDGKTNTDWKKAVRHNNIGSEKYILNYSGGSEDIRIFSSLSYSSQDGIARDSKFDRINGYLNADWSASDRMKVNFDLSLSKAKQTGPSDGSSFSNPIFAGYTVSPTSAIYNPDGSYNLDINYINPEFNPLAIQDANTRISNFYKVIANIGASYDLTNYLKLSTKFGTDYNFYDELEYWNPDFGDGNNPTDPLGSGYAYASQRNFNTWNWSNTLDFTKTFNDLHFISAAIGTEAIAFHQSIVSAERKGFPAGNRKPTLNNGANAYGASSSASDYSFASYFGRASYVFNNKYSITGNIRRDASSRFGKDNKWGTFWGVGAAWNINKENFLKGSNVVNELKLRGSYGTVGNAEIGNYASLSLYSASNGAYLSQSAGAINQIGSPLLKWETTNQLNLGLDFAFFKNRLRGSFDVYNKKANDLLYTIPTNATGTGFTSYWKNDGKMESRGLEASLTVVPVQTKDFNWTLTANYSYNDSEIKDLNNGTVAVRNGLKAWMNGHNPTEFYTRLWAGVDQSNGKPLWYTDETRTQTTSVVAQAKQVFTGKQALPVHTAGLSTSFTYKGLTISSQFSYAGGHSVYDNWGFVYNSDGAYISMNTRKEWVDNAWTPENAGNAKAPQLKYGGNSNGSSASTRYLYDADHIRWRSAEIGYRLGKSVLGDKLGVDNIYIYTRGYNLIVWTFDKDLWFDPETSSQANTYAVENMGIFNLTQPNLRQFTFGVKVDF